MGSASQIGVAEAGRLKLQCACGRCGASFDVTFALIVGGVSAPVQAGQCQACHHAFQVSLQQRLLHDANAVCAVVRASGCSPVDLLPSDFVAGCGDCGNSVQFRLVGVSERVEHKVCAYPKASPWKRA